jgi:DnaJ-class molecular chaperone
MRDPYAVLGVGKNASADDIKSAYRKAAKKHHPDQNPGDKGAQARFSELNQAYEILGDAKKRAEFDQGLLGPDGKPKFQGAGGPGGNPFEGFGGFARGFENGFPGGDRRRPQGADDILSELFGAAFNPSQKRRKADKPFAPAPGNDINIAVEISLDDVAAGKTNVELPTGARLSVSLPDGVVNGQVIRLKGKGYPSMAGGQPGDANITVRFKQEAGRRIDGSTLTIDVVLPLDIAILGGKVPVDTPDGRIAVTIPPMTNGDKVFRLRNRGLAEKNGTRGDLLIAVKIVLPKGVDAELSALAEKLRAKA